MHRGRKRPGLVVVTFMKVSQCRDPQLAFFRIEPATAEVPAERVNRFHFFHFLADQKINAEIECGVPSGSPGGELAHLNVMRRVVAAVYIRLVPGTWM